MGVSRSLQDGREKVSHGRVLRSLQSGLPNEVDFAFNVLTILSLEPQALDQPHSILKVSWLGGLLIGRRVYLILVFVTGAPITGDYVSTCGSLL